MVKTYLLIFWSAFIGSGLWASPFEWKKINEKDGIEVFKSDIQNSALISFKGVGIISADPERIFNIILDTKRAPEWVSDLVKSEVVNWINFPETYIEYNHINMPLIISDREFLSLVKINKEKNGSILVSYHQARELGPNSALPERLRNKSRLIRGEIEGSYFRVTPLDGGKNTLLEGVVVCDPKGWLPKWVVNLFQENWPIETINGIRKQAKKTDILLDKKFKVLF
jgi:hypothetical protein